MIHKMLYGLLTTYAWALAVFVDRSEIDTTARPDPVLYALTVVPAVLFILASVPRLARLRFDRASITLLLLLVLVALLSAAHADAATLVSVGTLCAMLVAIRQTNAVVSLTLVNVLFFASIFITETQYLLGSARYGVLPGQAVNDIVSWRASLFAYNVTPSWLFSLIVIGLNWFYNRSFAYRSAMILLGMFFLVFSASRTALLALGLCITFLGCTRVIAFRERTFYKMFIPVALVAFVLMLNAEQVLILLTGFDNPLVNAVLFRSEEGVANIDQASTSIVRTFIWAQHLQLFFQDPLFGVGTFNLLDTAPEFATVASSGTESFLTGLFARIGIAAVLFVVFILQVANSAARHRDHLSFSLMIIFAVTSLAYGSYIVPYDFIFLAMFGAMNFSRGRCLQADADTPARAPLMEAPTPAPPATGN